VLDGGECVGDPVDGHQSGDGVRLAGGPLRDGPLLLGRRLGQGVEQTKTGSNPAN
jgi:hypothetical protein